MRAIGARSTEKTNMYNALVVDKPAEGYRCTLESLDESRLPEGDVTVRVEWSTINFKDGLAITGKSPVVRKFPLTPGIDFAGIVETSAHPAYKPGDRVILNGWGVGEGHSGGLAQKARVNGDWLIPLPRAFTTRQAMAIGTAGYTAMLCAMALERHGVPTDRGDILVTGAAGGVGSVAIAILSSWGYRVVASTGRTGESDYLQSLGAAEVIDRKTLSEPGKPLQKERWAGVIDSVGSHTLANACAQTMPNGCVAACGLAQGMDFPSTVAPFILRGVTLAGVNSVYVPSEIRAEAWGRLAKSLDLAKLEAMTEEIALAEAIVVAPKILAGQVRGRLVVDVNR
jgi:acrylyl-CoA reductase (NADPH)